MVPVASSSGSAHGWGSTPSRYSSVGRRTERELVLALDAGERLLELGVVEQHRRAAVVDDVRDLLAVEAEVDRHQHAAERAHAEEAHEEAGAVLADDGDTFAVADAPFVECRRLRAGELGDAAVGEGAETTAGRVGFVDDSDA